MYHRFHRFDKLPDGLTIEEKYDYISKNSDSHEPSMRYTQPLTEEALNEFRAKFADEAIELNSQKDAMQEEVKQLKKDIKSIEDSMAKSLDIIRNKELEIIEPVFMFKDMPSKQMIYVNSEGIIVHVRELQDYEMQMSIGLQMGKEVHSPENKKKAKKEKNVGKLVPLSDLPETPDDDETVDVEYIPRGETKEDDEIPY